MRRTRTTVRLCVTCAYIYVCVWCVWCVCVCVCMRTQVRECVIRTQQVSISDRVAKVRKTVTQCTSGHRTSACVRAPTSIQRMHFFVEMTLRVSAQYNLPRIYNLHVQSRGDIGRLRLPSNLYSLKISADININTGFEIN